jgi:uncharacterized membrane protein YjgN (DUF898 family)
MKGCIMTWFYKDGERELGPVSKTQLQELIQSGQISGSTLIRNSPENAWRSLSEMVRSGNRDNHSPSLQPPMHAQDAQTSVVVLDAEVPLQFKGSGGEYFKIWIVNVLLSIVTLGIYSAWAKVRRKQYFYGNLHLSGASFRYMANPVKILKGRMVVFFGFVAYTFINQLFPAASIVTVIVLLIFIPFLAVRSLAFNARNSAWRNIRFNFAGNYAGAAKVFILWPILVVLTLGLLFPYVIYLQKKFIIEHSAYGTTRFTFHARGKDYYAIFLKFLIPIMIIAAIGFALGYLLLPYMGQMVVLASIWGIFLPVFYLYAFAYFSVRLNNLLYNSGALLDHRFKATMAIKNYALIVLTNTLATVCTLGLVHPFAQVRAFRYKIQNLFLLPGGDLDQFVAAELKETSALGDEASDFLDFDFGL